MIFHMPGYGTKTHMSFKANKAMEKINAEVCVLFQLGSGELLVLGQFHHAIPRLDAAGRAADMVQKQDAVPLKLNFAA